MCARHSFFRPNASVDLQKGERYSHGDYALAGALSGTETIPQIVFSYDVNCQFHRRIKDRFRTRFPDIALDHFKKVKYVIPKMHALAHVEDCQYLYSLNFTPGSGRTDGEAPERNWAALNPLSMSTREMNSAHRHEVLEDHMNEINFKKMITLRTSTPITQSLDHALTQGHI